MKIQAFAPPGTYPYIVPSLYHLRNCIFIPVWKLTVLHLYSCTEAVSFMVGCSGENAECPVNLLRKDHAHKLVRKCESRKAELQICSPQHIL